MNRTQINRALALRIGGWHLNRDACTYVEHGALRSIPKADAVFPDYAGDLNLVRKLLACNSQWFMENGLRYKLMLESIVAQDYASGVEPHWDQVMATPLQHCKAVLKVSGDWREPPVRTEFRLSRAVSGSTTSMALNVIGGKVMLTFEGRSHELHEVRDMRLWLEQAETCMQ